MTSRGVLVYKCRQCGKLTDEFGVPNLIEALTSIVDEGKTPQEWGITAHITTLHHCGSGIVGVADLICGRPDGLGPLPGPPREEP